MPFSANIFQRLYDWVTDAANNVKIRADRMDAEFDGVADALTTLRTESIRRDGAVTPTANQPFGGFRATGLGLATAVTDALSKRAHDSIAATAGTSTAYTFTSGYSLTDGTVYDGATVTIRPHVASGATPTIAVDTMTARTIVRANGTSVSSGELAQHGTYLLVYREAVTSWVLANIPAALPLAVNVQDFTGSGTWTKPALPTFVMVELYGAGGGGGGGRRGAAGSLRTGGGGGGGGAYTARLFLASDLTATVAVTIGAGGTAGTAATSNDTNGGNGGNGGNTTFGAYLSAFGGGGGLGGTSATGESGAGGGVHSAASGTTRGLPNEGAASALFGGSPGGTGGAQPNVNGGASGGLGIDTVSNSRLGGASLYGGHGGGGGGSITSGNVAQVGLEGGGGVGSTSSTTGGGAAGGAATGAAGTSGTGRQGAGGGGSNNSGAGGAGGVGGFASGGGGGGASLNGNNSGAGGAGGPGFARITTW